MDESRFDRWTRALATGTNRRRALQGVAGGILTGLLAHLEAEEATAACVKPGRKGCQGPQHERCCKGATCQGGTTTKEGKCVCKGSLKKCGVTCVNPKNDPKHCGGCAKKCLRGATCKQSRCVSALGCRAGEDFCQGSSSGDCPNSGNSNCHCVTDVDGIPRCVEFVGFVCSTCTTNAECGTGRACMDTATARCNTTCPNSACVPAGCGGQT